MIVAAVFGQSSLDWEDTTLLGGCTKAAYLMWRTCMVAVNVTALFINAPRPTLQIRLDSVIQRSRCSGQKFGLEYTTTPYSKSNNLSNLSSLLKS